MVRSAAVASSPLKAMVGLLLLVSVGCTVNGAEDPAESSGDGTVAIMPIGDSITAGPFYRIPFVRRVLSADCDVDFVGTFSGTGGDEPADADELDLDHQALGGATSREIREQLDGWLEQHQPDIALIYLGINDFYRNLDREETIENLDAVIDNLRTANPNVRILLAQIMPAVDVEQGVEALNTRIDQLGRVLDTTASPVVVVDMATGVDVDTDLVDDVHPDDAQSTAMADRWTDAIAPMLSSRCQL